VVHDLTSTASLIALGASVVAVVALAIAVATTLKLRRLYADQRLVLGSGDRDVVGHVADLQRAFHALQAEMEAVGGDLRARMAASEARLGGALTQRALVHFDAYQEMSGRNSSSLALLDASGSGVVLTAIHHRDQSRLYAKDIVRGASEAPLSPEEEEAVRVALAPAGAERVAAANG
jgi:hypothetical protein